jgi:hypothetical protein
LEQKSTNLKSQLDKQYHRASVVIGTSDSFWYQKDEQNYIRARSYESTDSQAPSSPSSASRRRKSELSSPSTSRQLSQSPATPLSQQSSFESLTPSSPIQQSSSPSPAYLTPQLRKSSKLFESILEDEGEGMNQPQDDLDDEDDDDGQGKAEGEDDSDLYHDISPLTYQSNLRGLERLATPQRLAFPLTTMAEETSGHSQDEDDEGNDQDGDDEDDDSEDR